MTLINFRSGVPKKSKVLHGVTPLAQLIGDSGPSETGSSYYKSMMLCAHEHALTYEFGLSAEGETAPLATGSIFHKALETYYSTILDHQLKIEEQDPERPGDYYFVNNVENYFFGNIDEAQQAAWNAIAPVASAAGYEEIYDDDSRMLEGYFQRYWNQDRWRVLAVEETIAVKTPILYSARLDLLFEDEHRMRVCEHKTAKSVNDDSLSAYDMDIQTFGQHWLVERCVDQKQFKPFDGVMVNITTKHKTTQFYRHNVRPNNRHLAMFEQTVGNWTSLRAANKRLGWPRSLGHCAGFSRGYAKCRFFDACHSWPNMSAAEVAANAEMFGLIKKEKQVTNV